MGEVFEDFEGIDVDESAGSAKDPVGGEGLAAGIGGPGERGSAGTVVEGDCQLDWWRELWVEGVVPFAVVAAADQAEDAGEKDRESGQINHGHGIVVRRGTIGILQVACHHRGILA